MDKLRQLAEAKVKKEQVDLSQLSGDDTKRLIHELRIHQIELTIQNEELQDTRKKLEKTSKRYADFYDHAPVGFFTLDKNGTIHDVNLTAAKQLGLEKEDIIKSRLYNYIAEQDKDTFFIHLRNTFEKQTHQACELNIKKKDGGVFAAQIESAAVADEENKIRICRTTITDVTTRKQVEEQLKFSLRDKEILLQEIHHRTKNNMQVISSLLTLQAAHSSNKNIEEILEETRRRIHAMALVHQKLYLSKDLSRINLREYIFELVNYLKQSYNIIPSNKISLKMDLENIFLLIDTAIPCGLILNELISNSLKHAFPLDKTGEISIKLDTTSENEIELQVSDNGVGIPEGFDFKQQSTLGMKLIFNIAEHQLGGTVIFENNTGVKCNIRFSEQFYKARI